MDPAVIIGGGVAVCLLWGVRVAVRRAAQAQDVPADDSGELPYIARAVRIFESVQGHFDSAQIKHHMIGDIPKVDLRGTYGGFPLKITDDLDLTVLVDNDISLVEMHFDESAIPTKRDHEDPFAEQDVERIFVARGLFLSCSAPRFTESSLEFWGRASEDLRQRLRSTLADPRLRYLMIRSGEIRASLQRSSQPGESEAIDYLVPLCDAMVAIAKEIERMQKTVGSAAEPRVEKVRLFKCEFCSTRNPLLEPLKCANCGAPYQ